MDLKQTTSSDQEILNLFDTSTGSNPPSGKPHVKLGTSNFVDLLGSKNESYYIDKTGLIEAFLKNKHNRVLVTGPRRFNKTTNISMLLAFFQLQLPAEESKNLSEEDFQKRIKETDNYGLFHEHGLYITKNSDLMTKHFGRYPVICISFSCYNCIRSYEEAVSFCMWQICETFAKHTYLQSSAALTTHEINICSKWINGEWDVQKELDQQQIKYGLRTLIQYLYKHFGRRVLVLVDEYDAVITKAMRNVKSKTELENIVTYHTSIITNAVKEDAGEHWVEYAFITGTSHIPGNGLSDGNIKPYKFLGNHNFVPYYGLTKKETEQLLKTTYGFNQQILDNLKNKFNSYVSEGNVEMYHLWSVLDYAGTHNNKMWEIFRWQDTEIIVVFKEAFKLPVIKKKIETKLLFDEPIWVDFKKNRGDIIKLITNPQDVLCTDHDLFFSLLLEQGYLSYVPDKPGFLMLPSGQIKEQTKEKLEECNVRIYGTSRTYQTLINNCKEFFWKVSAIKCDHDVFINFHKNLEILLQTDAASWLQKNEDNIRCTIALIADNLNFKVGCALPFNCEIPGVGKCLKKIDYILIKDSFVMIFECKYNETNKKAMLSMKDKHCCAVFQDKEVIKGEVTHYVLMGINMNENGQVSIGYLQDSQDFDAITLIP